MKCLNGIQTINKTNILVNLHITSSGHGLENCHSKYIISLAYVVYAVGYQQYSYNKIASVTTSKYADELIPTKWRLQIKPECALSINQRKHLQHVLYRTRHEEKNMSQQITRPNNEQLNLCTLPTLGFIFFVVICALCTWPNTPVRDQ